MRVQAFLYGQERAGKAAVALHWIFTSESCIPLGVVARYLLLLRRRRRRSAPDCAPAAPRNPMPACTLLLDRDGTLIEDKHYLADPAGVVLLPGVGHALAELAGKGWRFFVVSNQSGVGRGYFSESAVHACTTRLEELLGEFGVRLSGSAYCPHAPEALCTCRKPAVGMWVTLKQQYGLAEQTTVMVGDKGEDMGFAEAAGLAGRILVTTGKGEQTAARLGLPLPEGIVFSPCARLTPEHPDGVLRNFSLLPEVVERIVHGRGIACNA